MSAVPTFILLFSCLLHLYSSFPTEEPLLAEPVEKNFPTQPDMRLTTEQQVRRKQRKAIVDERYRWTNGFVPYVFQDAVNQTDVKAALDHWREHTCLKFAETNDTNQPHLQFHIGEGCWSYVGMIWSKKGQQVSIGPNCNDLNVVVHEVGHAIGWEHEQSRSDRDQFVIIIEENILPELGFAFAKEITENYSVPYDYTSIMHYGQSYFSIDRYHKPTIMTIDPFSQELIGARIGLTHRDKLVANIMYNCTGQWLDDCGLSSDPCLNDGYTGKNCSCICPPGTTGSTCEQVVGGYYDHMRSPLNEKITTEKKITIDTILSSGGTKFVKWIIPPAGKMAKVTFTYANLYTTCKWQYLRVRTNESDIVGKVLCSTDVFVGLTITSDTEIIIYMVNNVNYTWKKKFWEADVTFEAIPTAGTPTIQSTGSSSPLLSALTSPRTSFSEEPTEEPHIDDKPKKITLWGKLARLRTVFDIINL